MLINNWKFSTKIVIAFSTLVSLGMGSLALVQYQQLRTSQRQAMADRLSEIVQLATPQVDGDYHSLVTSAQDVNTTYYRINQEQLRQIQAASDDIQHLYTVRQQPTGKYTYVLDYRPYDNKPPATVGDALINPPSRLASGNPIEKPTVESKIVHNSAGIPVLTGYSPILGKFDRPSGLLVVELDARPVLKRERQAQQTTVVSLIAILLIMVVTVRYLAKMLVVNPTLMLNQAAKRLAQGEWSETLPTTRKDELGELAQSFNHMGQHLRKSFQQLEDYSQNLEKKVKARTQALSASQQLLNLVMNNIPQSIFWKDKENVYLGCNQSFADTVGVEVEKVVGKTDDELPWEEAEAQVFVKSDHTVIESGIAEVGIVEPQLRADGHQAWLEMSKVPLYDNEKQVMGLIGIFQDITPYKEAERAAHQASEAKSDFLANMNHELRTPLNGILGYTQILQRDPDTGGKHKKGLGTIHHCASHLLLLINDILDFSKLEVKKTELYPQDFHLGEFLNATVDMCRIKADQKGVQLIYHPPTDLPLAVNADDKRLRQVLLNLLGNSTKFTDSGTVTLRIDIIQVSVNAELPNADLPWRLRFEIEDTGIGIAADKLQKIFSPFEQASNRDRNAEGTGLGLAISRQIVQIMGGDIHVESELGKGSKFWFEIDLSPAKEWTVTHSNSGSNAESNIASNITSKSDIPLMTQPPNDHDAEAYIMPPASELKALYAAAKNGFMADVQQEAQRLKTIDNRYHALADRLLSLSHQFDDQGILELIRPTIQEAVVS